MGDFLENQDEYLCSVCQKEKWDTFYKAEEGEMTAE